MAPARYPAPAAASVRAVWHLPAPYRPAPWLAAAGTSLVAGSTKQAAGCGREGDEGRVRSASQGAVLAGLYSPVQDGSWRSWAGIARKSTITT